MAVSKHDSGRVLIGLEWPITFVFVPFYKEVDLEMLRFLSL